MTTFHTYILRCSDGSLYVGHTDEIGRRLSEHESGMHDGYTRSRRPLALVYCEAYETRDGAFQRERQIKGWSRTKKEALIRQDWRAVMHQAASLSKLRKLIIWDET